MCDPEGECYGECDPEPDHWQEYKDDVAMGYIWADDGTQRDPDPPEPDYGGADG